MGEKTDRDIRTLRERLKERLNGKTRWAIGGVSVLGLVTFAFTNGWIVVAFETTAHAASTYETKIEADRAHLGFQAQINTMEDDHRELTNEIRSYRAEMQALHVLIAQFMVTKGIQPASSGGK